MVQHIKVCTRTETPLHLTDGQANSTESTDDHVCSIPGHRREKSGCKIFGIPFMAIGGPTVEQPWPSVRIGKFRIEKFEIITWYGR